MEEAADGVHSAERPPLLLDEQRDWLKSRRRLLTDSYRAGRSEGEEANLQQHFDAGYQAGLERVWPIAQTRGRLCAAIAVCHLGGDQSELPKRAGRLVARLTELERTLATQPAGSVAHTAEIPRRLTEAHRLLTAHGQ